MLVASAERYADDIAVIEADTRLTYAALRDAALEVARAAITLGIGRGDRVAVWAPNSSRWVVLSLGLLCAGATIVPLNTRFRGPESLEIITRVDASAVFLENGFLGYDYAAALRVDDGLPAGVPVVDIAEATADDDDRVISWARFVAGADAVDPVDAVHRAEAVSPDDLSEIIFTSGTTGRPKGATIPHGRALDLYSDYGRLWGLRRGDRYLVTNPFFHTAGNKAGIITSLLHGVTIVPVRVFDVTEVLRLIGEHRISVMNGPPTIFYSLLEAPDRASYDLSSLRVAATGAAVVPVALVERARTDLPFERFITAYGMTECFGTATMCRAGDGDEVIATTNGRPLPGVELRIVTPDGSDLPPGEAGEVLIRGENVTPGYWEDPETTAATIDADGWLHSGDIGMLDSAGNLIITDRLKDLFFVGGFTVSPAEIEQVLARHPEISEVAVIGVSDDRLGEVPKAYVVPRPGATPGEDETIAWTRERLANFKVPRTIEFVRTLPRNASGKILKGDLRESVAGRAPT